MSARLLVIEDEAPVRAMVRLILEDEGFDVIEAVDGEAGLAAFDEHAPDLVLVDLRLPGAHGFEVCRALRASSDVPIIILTAQVDSHDVVAGLEAGADDYVTKPFVAKELAARIRAALRRSDAATPPSEPLVRGGLTIDRARFRVLRGDEEVRLTPKEYDLLIYLLRHPNRVLTREQLVALSSGRSYESQQRAIDLQISRLRAKLGDDLDSSPLIKTVRNEGYVLAAAVTVE